MLNNPSNECTSIFNIHLNLKNMKIKHRVVNIKVIVNNLNELSKKTA